MDSITSQEGKDGHVGDPIQLGIVTVSDRASSGLYTDLGGPAILSFFQQAIRSPWTCHYACVADERQAVEDILCHMADVLHCSVIVTTGGTGPAVRDITPEATEAVCSKMLPGFGEQMRRISLAYVPTAILSRQVGGIRGQSLLFNLPGQPKSIRETIDEIWRAVPYCVDLIGGPYLDMDENVCNAYRPAAAKRQS